MPGISTAIQKRYQVYKKKSKSQTGGSKKRPKNKKNPTAFKKQAGGSCKKHKLSNIGRKRKSKK